MCIAIRTHQQRRLSDAKPLLLASIAINKSMYGAEHPLVLQATRYLAVPHGVSDAALWQVRIDGPASWGLQQPPVQSITVMHMSVHMPHVGPKAAPRAECNTHARA